MNLPSQYKLPPGKTLLQKAQIVRVQPQTLTNCRLCHTYFSWFGTWDQIVGAYRAVSNIVEVPRARSVSVHSHLFPSFFFWGVMTPHS